MMAWSREFPHLPRTGTRNRVIYRASRNLHAAVAWWGAAPRFGQRASAARCRPGGAWQARPGPNLGLAGEPAVRLLELCWACGYGGGCAGCAVVGRGLVGRAPVLMVAGWTVAAGLQPRSFDPVAQPVSVLAAPGAADRWVMTLTFLVVGACDVVTGISLRPARAPGRLILMAAAAAGILVAANPEHPGTSFPLPHMIWTAAGCAALVAWPAGAWRRGPSVPWGLRPAVSASAVTVLLALLAWFGAELITGGGQAGLAERVFGAAQALWPLAVVVSCRRAARAGPRPGPVPGLNRSGARPAVDAQRPGWCAQLMFHDVPPGIVTGCLTEPTCMIVHGLVSPETHDFAAERAYGRWPRTCLGAARDGLLAPG